jgi:hypothetical protein
MNNNIPLYIYELLFRHDCVIIPNVGGFVASHKPASINKETKEIHPPSKHLLFNKNLINNDGLLANKISEEENIPYKEALGILDNFSNEITAKLNKENRFEIPNIGVMYMSDGVYQFNSNESNLLMSSTGMPVISTTKHKLETNKKEAPIIDINSKAPKESKANKINKRWYVAAALLPIFIYSLWLSMSTDILTDSSKFHYSDLNPFKIENFRTYSQDRDIERLKTEDYTEENISELIESNSSDSKYGEYPLDDNKTTVTVELIEIKDAEVVSTFVETTPAPNLEVEHKAYYLIAGSFSKKTNANNFLNKLIDLGYKALKIDNKGNIRVALGSYSSRKQAKKARKECLNRDDISTWILKNK